MRDISIKGFFKSVWGDKWTDMNVPGEGWTGCDLPAFRGPSHGKRTEEQSLMSSVTVPGDHLWMRLVSTVGDTKGGHPW